MENIDTLYHYTNIESLAMILENHTIRFSNLCSLDDPLEKYVRIRDYDPKDHHLTYVRKNYGMYCFVSCWTSEEDESIAMWDMYGDRKQGVRISLPQEMFDNDYNINAPKGKNKSKSLISIEAKIVQPEFYYVDYSRLDDPEMITKDWKIEIGNLGKYKTKDWAFQKECRFRLYASKGYKSNTEYWFVPKDGENLEEMISQNPLPQHYIDFKLKPDIFKELGIILGPNIPEPKRVLLYALLNKYNIGTERLKDSRFKDTGY